MVILFFYILKINFREFIKARKYFPKTLLLAGKYLQKHPQTPPNPIKTQEFPPKEAYKASKTTHYITLSTSGLLLFFDLWRKYFNS
jgi:hypothetical protein